MFNVKQHAALSFLMLVSLAHANPADQAASAPVNESKTFSLDGGRTKNFHTHETEEYPEVVSTVDPSAIAKQIPAFIPLVELRNLLTQLSATEMHVPELQQEILAKLISVFIACAREHGLQALHDIGKEIAGLEYRKYHPFKSLFVQPTDIFYGSVEPRYNRLAQLRDRYLQMVGRMVQLNDPSAHDTHDRPELNEMHEWAKAVIATVNELKDSSSITDIKKMDYRGALQILLTGCDTLYAYDIALCRREEPILSGAMGTVGRVAYWTGRAGLSLSACAGGGFLISRYIAGLQAADVAQVKANYKRAVRNFHRQFVIPGVTLADIDQAAENLDTSFLEDRVIPAVTHRVRTVNDWIPEMLQRAFELRRTWMPDRVEEILRRIPARTIAVATTLLWLTDKTVCDVLPWGVETVVGLTALAGSAAFVDRVAAVADALITAAGGVTVAPDMGMLLALTYKKKMKLAVLKYGGGVLGFAGLYALYCTILKLNESKLSERLTDSVHTMIATLAPYSRDTTGQSMKAADLGWVLHCADEIQRELRKLESDKQRIFDHDIVALQSIDTPAGNRIELLDSMYKTYSLVTLPV
jgi:hypothetical protein